METHKLANTTPQHTKQKRTTRNNWNNVIDVHHDGIELTIWSTGFWLYKIHWCSNMSECYNIGEWDQWSLVMYLHCSCFKRSRCINTWCKKQLDLISSFRFCFDHTFVRVCCWFRYFLNLMNALTKIWLRLKFGMYKLFLRGVTSDSWHIHDLKIWDWRC